MKHHKLVHNDGTIEDLEVDRVVRDGETIYADARIDGSWSNVPKVDVADIEEVRRRITDFNGERRWIRHSTSYLADRFDVDVEQRPAHLGGGGPR